MLRLADLYENNMCYLSMLLFILSYESLHCTSYKYYLINQHQNYKDINKININPELSYKLLKFSINHWS
jgi:hypothetical protein